MFIDINYKRGAGMLEEITIKIAIKSLGYDDEDDLDWLLYDDEEDLDCFYIP